MRAPSSLAAAAVLATLALAACASAPPPAAAAPDRPGLLGRTLEPGECALFVWTRDPDRTLTLFSSAADAALWTGSGARTFSPSAAPLGPEQSFEVDGEAFRLALGSPAPFGTGTRYSSGSLRSQRNGWNVVQPVVGLTACG